MRIPIDQLAWAGCLKYESVEVRFNFKVSSMLLFVREKVETLPLTTMSLMIWNANVTKAVSIRQL
jgi:hypothetical protein